MEPTYLYSRDENGGLGLYLCIYVFTCFAAGAVYVLSTMTEWHIGRVALRAVHILLLPSLLLYYLEYWSDMCINKCARSHSLSVEMYLTEEKNLAASSK